MSSYTGQKLMEAVWVPKFLGAVWALRSLEVGLDESVEGMEAEKGDEMGGGMAKGREEGLGSHL